MNQNPRVEIQFPQPTRPINSYDMNSPIFPQATDDVVPTIISKRQQPDDWAQSKTTTTTLLQEEDLRLILDIYEKLPEKIRHQLNLEGLIGKITAQKASQEDFTCFSRGLEGFDQMEEFAQKLGRFKIRTLDPNGGTVVKEESKH